MDALIIEKVRCFADPQKVPLAPLTLLVGENSTGKTTFLAACRLAWDALATAEPLDFNADPFFLGAYDQIATCHGGRSQRARSFTIGLGTRLLPGDLRGIKGVETGELELRAEFEKQGSQPRMRRLLLELPPYIVSILQPSGADKLILEGTTPDGPHTLVLPVSHSVGMGPPGLMKSFFSYITALPRDRGAEAASATDPLLSFAFVLLLSAFAKRLTRPYALGPFRTAPQRTYNPSSDKPRADGGHVPMVLNRLRSANPARWKSTITQLSKFGHACGLFEHVSIRRLGRSESDPFQLQVELGGPKYNVLDVGYGVSQALPILVDAIRGEKIAPVLLQQPEVHLHPRAQAELGTFLATVAVNEGKQFIVETHSDYLVDRVRMDIRDKKNGIKAKDVQILYFARRKDVVDIHPIGLDKRGNIIDPPPGYREFFMREENRFLGI